MPRKVSSQKSEAVTAERQLIWAQFGSYNHATVGDFDPKAEALVEALLHVVSTGATLVLRPGSGGRSLGIAIWEGDFRGAPQWLYDSEEVDNWATTVLSVKRAAEAQAAD